MEIDDDPLTLASPDGRITLDLQIDAAGMLRYSLRFGDVLVIDSAALGLEFTVGDDFGPLEVVMTTFDANDETYTLCSGKSSLARDRYQELTISLQETTGIGRRLSVVFRAYNDGIAFRYVVPTQAGFPEIVAIQGEHSTFRFAEGCRALSLRLPGFATSFEGEYTDEPLADWQPGTMATLPLTLCGPDDAYFAAITEARLTDYAGMYLTPAGDGRTLRMRLAPQVDAGESGVCVRTTLPVTTPWRVVLLGDSPGALIESNLILALNDPVALTDTSWIKPGKVLWDWWSGTIVSAEPPTGGMDTATIEHYIDFAAEWGLEYMLIDGGWYGPSETPDADITRAIPALDLPHLLAHANARGVDILLWMHQHDTRGRLEEAFALYETWGVKGVKVDFFDRDDQATVAYIDELLRVAARHRLLVDLHGVYKPTGLQRTYPNLMTHEGVMGAEYNKWSARVTTRHNVTLPFTRMLAGPMDYTPGAFGNVTPDTFVARNRAPMAMGTRCHQLAMYVVYESGLQMVSDYPNAYRGQPGAEFLKIVPAVWDETRYLAGAVAEYIVLARRKGDRWFVGAMTDAARTVTLPLGFLPEGTRFDMTLWHDAADADIAPTHLSVRADVVDRIDSWTVALAPGGGCVAMLIPQA